MCGIFGYIGDKEAIPLVLEGIKKLEYRGYDSAGLAAIADGQLFTVKQVGKVSELEKELERVMQNQHKKARVGLSHTRWATHGKPTVINAHPHSDSGKKLTLVHNGIIENHDALRRMLHEKGVECVSDTDTEVVSQLIGYLYRGDFLRAVQKALPLLKGAFALAAIHEDHPGQIVCATREAPLAIGIGKGETFLASDAQALLKYTKRVIYLSTSEVAVLKEHSVEVFDERELPVTKETQELEIEAEEVTKGKYSHYTLKEIYDQPQTIRNALLARYSEEYGTALLDEINLSDEELQKVERIVIVACGTSWHAGLVGGYMIEERARIPVQVEISSEFRYKNPIVQANTLAIAISQSGETADTIAAMRELKEKGAKVIGICNVQKSTIAREVDGCLFLRAGPEIGVCSTKAFTSQIVVLSLFTLRLARMRSMSKQEGKKLISSLTELPAKFKSVLDLEEDIKLIAAKYAKYDNFFFLGRRFMYPTALEGALKLKEIAYINANGYPSGEMKHGPIALINENCPTVAFCADMVTYPKMLSNLMEVKARNGKVIAVVPDSMEEIRKIADEIIPIPSSLDDFSTVLSAGAAQLLAYHIALLRNTEIDQPRNLAKSVTVE